VAKGCLQESMEEEIDNTMRGFTVGAYQSSYLAPTQERGRPETQTRNHWEGRIQEGKQRTCWTPLSGG